MLHGDTNLRGINPPQSQFHDRGRFGRLFPGLRIFAPDNPAVRAALLELGKQGGLMDAMDATPTPKNPDNTTIPAGFTFFGQFVDHDLTFDPTSILERQNDPEALENFRTPALELDHVYGSGPRVSRHLYDINDPAKFLIEKLDGPTSQDDMPRNSQLTAIISDPRNDENVQVSQLHVAFLKFHNAVVDLVRQKNGGITDPFQVFERAQRIVRWHYQWIVVHEFLPKIVGQDVVTAALHRPPDQRLFRWRHNPFIPVEFSVAAYRFGHSQVRPGYRLNGVAPGGFAAGFLNSNLNPADPDPADLRGGKRAARRFVEWDLFFNIPGATRTPQNSKSIDTKLSSPLLSLIPGAPGQIPGNAPGTPGNPQSLAQRNLLRSLALALPSGQAMAKVLRLPVLTPDQLQDLKQFNVGFESSTPPWYYILKESELNQVTLPDGTKVGGTRIGPLGGFIVADVIVGMIQGDRFSFLNANPNWRPELANDKGEFLMADLLRIAGVKLGP